MTEITKVNKITQTQGTYHVSSQFLIGSQRRLRTRRWVEEPDAGDVREAEKISGGSKGQSGLSNAAGNQPAT